LAPLSCCGDCAGVDSAACIGSREKTLRRFLIVPDSGYHFAPTKGDRHVQPEKILAAARVRCSFQFWRRGAVRPCGREATQGRKRVAPAPTRGAQGRGVHCAPAARLDLRRESNQWKNRWQSGNSDVVLSNDPNYDPNHDPDAAHTDYKRSGVRPR